MRVLVEFCRSGLHKMTGSNLLWHTRYDKTGAKTLKRECRACANARYRAKRGAAKRNHELELEALASVRETIPDQIVA